MKIEYIRGDYNSSCLAMGGKRITNGKILGVGYSVCIFDASVKPGDMVEVYKGELFVNGESTQGVLTKEELEDHIKEIEKRRKRFIKDIKHKHNWELCNREKWTIKYMEPCEYCEHSEHCYDKLTDGCDKTIAYEHDKELGLL